MTHTHKINPTVLAEQKSWGEEKNEQYFEQFRSKPEDLYRSEKFFLPDVLKCISSCLDVGCACGGFSAIMKSFNPKLAYAGVDITPRFIEIAQEKYPDSRFSVADATNLPWGDNSFDLVHCSGILHLTSFYKEIVSEMYRVSSKYVLCDFRFTEGPQKKGIMKTNLSGQTADAQTLPYLVINFKDHVEFLKSLTPAPASIEVKGYSHPPTKLAEVDINEIIMAFVLIEKGNAKTQETKITINLKA